MDPFAVALVLLAFLLIRFVIPATVTLTIGKVLDRYFPAK
jgi:hypothetical protein